MATNTKKTTEAIENNDDNRVAVTLPRARGNEDPNLFVSINGVAYLVPKGETTMVPPEVAYEIKRAQEAEAYMFDQADALAKATQ